MDIITTVVFPLLIFLSRVVDVTIGTLRIIFVSRGMKLISAVLGFFEVLIWILALGQIMQNLTDWTAYVAYSLGFAAGNYVGIYIEEKIAMGTLFVQIITKTHATKLRKAFQKEKFVVTRIKAEGAKGTVDVLYLILRRRRLNRAISLIHEYNPNAFYAIEDVRFVSEGSSNIPVMRSWQQQKLSGIRNFLRKKK